MSNVEEKAQLFVRCRLMLDAIERAEASSVWTDLRSAVDANAGRLGALRILERELRTIVALLPAEVQREVEHGLAELGVDVSVEQVREAAAVSRVRKCGRIRSEAEYRLVQAYADRLGALPSAQEEHLALGVLLDSFMAGEVAS